MIREQAKTDILQNADKQKQQQKKEKSLGEKEDTRFAEIVLNFKAKNRRKLEDRQKDGPTSCEYRECPNSVVIYKGERDNFDV